LYVLVVELAVQTPLLIQLLLVELLALERPEVVLAVQEVVDAGVRVAALAEPVVILEPVEQVLHGLTLAYV
jgi:hypothetical protein